MDSGKLPPDVLERFILATLQNATATAALNAAHARGRDNREFADQLAVDAMRTVLNRELLVPAHVVIGEGERDQAPELFVGERLGPEGPSLLQLAVDPLEGTNLCARGEPGAVCVIAAALDDEGSLFPGIDCYCDKVVVGREVHEWVNLQRRFAGHQYSYDCYHSLLDVPTDKLAHWIACALRKPVTDVVAMILDRPRNQHLIEGFRSVGAQIRLIGDGDVTAALLALDPRHDVDVAIGIGGSAEGVLAAAMARVYGGRVEARWWFPDNILGTDQAVRLQKLGIDLGAVHDTNALASGHVLFSLTAVTPNDLLPGVRYERGAAHTWTVSGRSRTGSLNMRHTVHRKPPAPPRVWPSKEGSS